MTYLLSSCIVTHNGTISSTSVGKPVKYVDIAVGVSQVNKLFCIGGISQDALVLESRRVMIKNRPLNQNEEYVNFTVDFKHTFYPFWSQTKVTLCADVVKYTNDTLIDIYSENYKRKIFSQYPVNQLFDIGDSVIYHNNLNGTILSILSAEKVRILYKTNKNSIRTRVLSVEDIYTKSKGFKGNTIGGIYSYDIPSNNAKITITGKIIAFGLYQLIIEEKNGHVTKLYYDN